MCKKNGENDESLVEAGMGVSAAMGVGRVERHRYVVLRAFEEVQPNRLNSHGW